MRPLGFLAPGSRKLGSRPRRNSPCRLALQALERRDTPSTVSGTVFNDANSNGLLDGGESGLAAWTLYLDVDRDTILDVGESSGVTDANGQYLFDTTDEGPSYIGGGHVYDFVALNLEVGTAGRWMNTSPTFARVDRPVEPVATRNFGVMFQPPVGVAPVGSETRINSLTTGTQGESGVTHNYAGDYAVSWLDGATSTRLVRIFNADGSPRTGEITFEGGAVALAGNGKFMAAWNTSDGIYVRGYLANGTPAANAVKLESLSARFRGAVTGIAADNAGNFAISYRLTNIWNQHDLYIQRLTSTGAKVGKVIKVTTANESGVGPVVMSASGTFAAMWNESTTLNVQRYQADGKPLGARISVVTAPSAFEWKSIAMNAAGQFVVGWSAGGQSNVRRYNADGSPSGGVVSVPTGFGYYRGSIALDGAGNVMIAREEWSEPVPDTFFGIALEVRVRRLTTSGLEPETIVNTTTQGKQEAAGLAVVGNGLSFVVVWTGNGVGDDAGVFLQRYGPYSPLLAAGGPAAGNPTPLTDAQLAPIVREAVRRWNTTGLTAAERALLKTVTVRIGDLDGVTLGLTTGTSITIDRDAAGYGWFVDPTPRSDSEFHRKGDQGEQGKMDLLTAVVHELGHVLGRDHTTAGVMSETLAAGTRESLVPGVHVGHGLPDAPSSWFLSSRYR